MHQVKLQKALYAAVLDELDDFSAVLQHHCFSFSAACLDKPVSPKLDSHHPPRCQCFLVPLEMAVKAVRLVHAAWFLQCALCPGRFCLLETRNCR